MVEKLKIAQDWLPRYTGSQIDELGDYILLTNFKNYVNAFAERFNCEIKGEGGAMQSAVGAASPVGQEREKKGSGGCKCLVQ